MTSTIQSLQRLSAEVRSTSDERNGVRHRPAWRRLGQLTAAAALLFLAVFLVVSMRASYSFADVLDKVADAHSVRFVVKSENQGRSQPEVKMVLQDEFIRHEIAGGQIVMILNAAQRKGLEIHRHRKVVKEIDLVGRVPAEELKDPVQQLRNLKNQKDANVERMADDVIDGRSCHVYEVKGATALRMSGPWKLWVDPKTKLPVKMRVGDAKTSLTFEQFVWGKRLDAKLFSMKPPAGFVFETALAAKIRPGQIHYHKWSDFHSIDSDGKNPQRQFLPRSDKNSGSYVADRAELSPDGRYLAIAYSSHRQQGAYPPERILLWDRTQPATDAVEIYSRPGAELQQWRFSPDGKLLYVSWWQQLPEKTWPIGLGAEVIDLKTKARRTLDLPIYKNHKGLQVPAQFAAAAADGSSYLVVGKQLQLISKQGKLLRQLTQGSGTVIARSVRFSPDGQRIVYVVTADNGYQLCLLALAGGKPAVLEAAGKLADFRARWSPDGKRIAYSCRSYDADHPRRFGNHAYLKVVPAEGGQGRTLISEKTHPNAVSIKLTAWR